jgi:hypothetical protein
VAVRAFHYPITQYRELSYGVFLEDALTEGNALATADQGEAQYNEQQRTASAGTVAGRDRGASAGDEAVYRIGANRVGALMRCGPTP